MPELIDDLFGPSKIVDPFPGPGQLFLPTTTEPRILQGHVIDLLRKLPEKSVQCIVTSPPYFHLRNYGTPTQIWGEGWQGEFGQEPTRELYIQHTVEILREIRRVLRDDGVVFWNISDSYNNNNNNGFARATDNWKRSGRENGSADKQSIKGIPHKSLLLIPERIGIALQDDGWVVRSRIVWAKPNPMPSAAQDRPGNAYETLWMLTKKESYYWDVDGWRETFNPKSTPRNAKGKAGSKGAHQMDVGLRESAILGDRPVYINGAQAKNVWTITNQPYRAAHFATFSPDLPERAMLLSTPEGGSCAFCGSPRERIIELGDLQADRMLAGGADQNLEYNGEATKEFEAAGAQNASDVKRRILNSMRERKTVGWKKTCECPTEETMPAIVLDPFAGSGTTLAVAAARGRRSVGIELKVDYIQLIQNRIREYAK